MLNSLTDDRWITKLSSEIFNAMEKLNELSISKYVINQKEENPGKKDEIFAGASCGRAGHVRGLRRWGGCWGGGLRSGSRKG